MVARASSGIPVVVFCANEVEKLTLALLGTKIYIHNIYTQEIGGCGILAQLDWANYRLG
jgi:hypothetical protein